MSRIRADKFVNSGATGAPQLTYGAEVVAGVGLTGAGGINITGIATAASFVGNVTGNVTGNATGLTGTPDITVRNIIGVGATLSGILTYEDVTNIDSLGIVTARTGIKVLAGGINAAGISTFSGSTFFTGGLAEKYENAGTTLGIQTANPLSDGNVILFTGNESSGTLTINFTGVHSTLSNGETVSFTAIITPNGTGIITIAQVDGQAISIKWSGGSAPSAGASGQDIYQFQILKTGTGVSDYTIFGAATNYA
jgi:hypothetical protein